MGLVDKTVFVRRANVLLEVSQETLEKYLNDGYDLVDKTGKLIREGAPNDDFALKRAYSQQEKEIKALTEQIEALKEELEAAKNPPKKMAEKKTQRQPIEE